ncbi:MAG: SMP-30/gluconolactonase/LRE family protein [Ilyomonas sp.]
MKYLLTILVFTALGSTVSAQHSLTKLWTTDSTLITPESVLYDGQQNVLFVSLIDGDASAKDGKGGVAKVGLDGKIINANFTTGLNAPKGLGRYGNNLYVADIDEVVVVDINSGKVKEKIPVEGATFLNDVSVNAAGDVYVSDSRTGKIITIKNGKASTYIEGLTGPNGVLAVDNNLYVLASGSLLKYDAQKKMTTIAEGMDKSTDGVEQVMPGEFLVSCWSGIVYYVKADGSKQVLFDTRDEKINSADIGYDAAKKIVYVPTFMKNSVVAYQLK